MGVDSTVLNVRVGGDEVTGENSCVR